MLKNNLNINCQNQSKEDYKNSNVVKVETYEELNKRNTIFQIFERIINQSEQVVIYHIWEICVIQVVLKNLFNLSHLK